MELRTEKEKERAERNKVICSAYKKQREKNPEASRNRIIAALASEFKMSSQAVRGILINSQVY